MTMELATSIARHASYAVLLMGFAAGLLALLRWPRVLRHDYLVAIAVILFSTALVQVPVYVGGMLNWGVGLVLFSGVARWGQVVGAILYAHAAFRDTRYPLLLWPLLSIVAFWTAVL